MALALGATMALGTSSAQAVTPGACSLLGATGSLMPSIQLQGGTGAFTFGGTATCGLVQGWVSASGTYTNITCGSGTFTGRASGMGFPNPFHILYAGWVGVLFAGTTENPAAVRGHLYLLPTGPDFNPPNCVSILTWAGSYLP